MTKDEKIEQLKRIDISSLALHGEMRSAVEQCKKEKRHDLGSLASTISINCLCISMLTRAVIKLMEDKDDE